MKPKPTLFVAAALVVCLLIAGCNIFEWSSGESAESLIDEGRQHMRDGDYDQALQCFTAAMEDDPSSSDARYYHAKATLRGAGFNALTLGTIMTEDYGDGDGLPFTGTEWPRERANKLYQAVNTVYGDIEPIYSGQTTGSYDSSDIDLDLGIISGIRGILALQDTKYDHTIDDDDFSLSFIYSEGSADSSYKITNLPSYFVVASPPVSKQGQPISAASGEIVVINSLVVQAFNMWIDSVAVIIQNSLDIIVPILSEDIGLDPDEVKEVLNKVIELASYYKINDGVDNDGDGFVDEEIIDAMNNDGHRDVLIDEDSDGRYVVP